MRLKRFLLTTLALASLSLFSPGLLTSGSSFITPASAAVEVEIGIDQFYDELSPYGDWVNYRGGYVFIPGDVPDQWRPYSLGRWAYTDEYGWLWVSDEPFGWATYHYGRWGYGDDIGWYWVPGRVWAPAWVSWRRGPETVVWAPLPPAYGDEYYDEEGEEDVEVVDSEIPEYYWNAVPAARFLEANLSVFIYADDDEDYDYRRRRYIDETEYLGPVRYRNKMLMNNILGTDYIERETNRKVRRYKVKETNDFRRVGKHDGDELVIYDRKVRYKPNAKPIKIKNVDEVNHAHGNRWKRAKGADGLSGGKDAVARKKQKGFDEEQTLTGQTKKRNQQSDTEFGQGSGKNKKKAKRADDQPVEAGKIGKKKKGEVNDEQQSSKKRQQLDGQPVERKKKKQQNQDFTGDNSAKKKQKQGGEFFGQDGKKKKKNNQGGDEFSSGKQKNRNLGSADQQDSGGSKKKKRLDAENQDQSGNNKKRKSKGACDPGSGENCQ